MRPESRFFLLYVRSLPNMKLHYKTNNVKLDRVRKVVPLMRLKKFKHALKYCQLNTVNRVEIVAPKPD